jgi:predicted CXXCH cytochrome family protein
VIRGFEKKMRKTALFPILLAAAVTLAAAPAASRAGSLRLIAPSADALVDMDKVLLIVKLEGGGDLAQLELIDNGKSVGFLPVRGAAAFTLLRLSDGPHDIAFAAPGMKRAGLKVVRGKPAGYLYHGELPDPKACAQCHPYMEKGSWALPGQQKWMIESVLCGQCHALAERGEYVHGPVAAGVCTPCHDPHGSSNPLFLKMTGKTLCLGCHDQNLSVKHIESGKNADCQGCHDPHSSAKKFHLRDAKK